MHSLSEITARADPDGLCESALLSYHGESALQFRYKGEVSRLQECGKSHVRFWETGLR